MAPRRKPRAAAAETPRAAPAAPAAAPGTRLRVLYVEDRAADVELALLELRRAGLEIEPVVVATRPAYEAALRDGAYDLILSDYSLEGWTGMDALDAARGLGRDVPFMLVTGSLGDEAAVECLKRGVADYVTKDRLARLPMAIRHALDRHALRRREAEAVVALREREERLRQIAENMQEVYHLFTADGTETLYVSPAYATIFGRSVQSLFDDPMSFAQAVHPDDRPKLLEDLARIRAGEARAALELRVVRPDGEQRWILARAAGIKDAQGVVRRVASVALDITDRKRVEEALAFQNVVLATQQETSLDGILVVDEGGSILFYNRRFAEIWELPNDTLEGRSDARALADSMAKAADPEAFLARIRYLYDHRDERSQEAIALQDGRTIERYSAPMLGPDGRYYGRVWYFRDITERRRAEAALQASEVRFRSLIERGMDLISIVDAESRFQYVSPAITRLLGYRPEDLVGTSGFDYVHPDELPQVRAAFERAMVGNSAEVREGFRFRHADGSWRVLESVVTNLLHEPTVAGVVVNSRDVTERRQAEEKLRWERFLMQALLETIPDPIYFKDDASRFLRVNQAWARRVGLDDPAGALGKTDFDFFGREHAHAAREIEERILRTGEGVVNFEEEETWPDRPSAWVSTTKMPLRDASGATVGTFGISRDISERRRAVELLRRSEAEFRSLIEHAPVGIYRATRSGRFLTVNPALVRMLGYGWAEELMRLDLARDVYADPAERDRLIRESPERIEVAWKRKDGSPITVELTSHLIPVPADAEEVFEGVVVDVTQQRSLESQFRQAQRLEAVGRLAGGVAHDFNNILTAITGYADLLLGDFDRQDPRRADLEEIHSAAQRAAALTRQLLAFSRKQVLQTRVLDLNGTMQSLEKMLRRLIGEDIVLVFTPGPDLGRVKADPGQVEQVILNLAVNSRDAMPGGGRITIETANVDFDDAYARAHAGATPGRYVMLALSDTGCGMDADTQSHIFEPFFTTKEQGKGTGLGLATVYGIVKQSGGYVWVYSEPGRGASFKIYLPRVDAPLEDVEPAADLQHVPGGGETVLLAEDDGAVREVVANALTQKGYKVLRAMDGHTAVEIARAERDSIRLLITDIVMPGMTGRELAEVVTAECPGVRVLYMSGYTDDAVVRHGVLDLGMPYLQKPFTPRTLTRKVREVLDAR